MSNATNKRMEAAVSYVENVRQGSFKSKKLVEFIDFMLIDEGRYKKIYDLEKKEKVILSFQWEKNLLKNVRILRKEKEILLRERVLELYSKGETFNSLKNRVNKLYQLNRSNWAQMMNYTSDWSEEENIEYQSKIENIKELFFTLETEEILQAIKAR